MPVGEIDSVSSTVITGAILLFNVICGTGSLTLPKAFEDAGVLYSAISLGAISLFSVLGACTIADCLAICNKSSAAYDSEHWQDNNEVLITNAIEDNHSDEVHHNSDDERFISVENEPLLSNAVCNDISSEYRSRTVRCKELGQVIRCIFPGWVCFMLTMSMFLYLTGDLSIYLVTVGKTITELACNAQPVPGENTSFWLTMDLVNKQTRCSNAMPLSTINFYRISVVGFWFVFLLIAFLKPEKSKFIHYVSSFCRFVSLSAMIVISVMHCFQPNKSLTTLMKKKKKHKFVNGPLAALFGNALYAFMCHHSVSRLIEPIVLANGKKPYKRTVFGVFVLVLILYLTLCISAHFAFGPNISSLYTLNFSSKRYWPLNIFILLTPVVMIASSFPILLYTLARSCEQLISSLNPRPISSYLIYALIPSCALLPLIISLFCFQKLNFLVGITGSYSANIIQNIFPGIMAFGMALKLQRLHLIGRWANLTNNLRFIISAILIGYASISMLLVTLMLLPKI